MAYTKAKNNAPAQPKPLTEEEKEQMQLRAVAQKREAFAQIAYGGLMNNRHIIHDGKIEIEAAEVARYAVSAADALIEELYGKKIKVENIEK